jgi:hypothetical protein
LELLIFAKRFTGEAVFKLSLMIIDVNKGKRDSGEDLKSQAGICRGDVVQKLVRVLADEWLLVVASCLGRESFFSLIG